MRGQGVDSSGGDTVFEWQIRGPRTRAVAVFDSPSALSALCMRFLFQTALAPPSPSTHVHALFRDASQSPVES